MTKPFILSIISLILILTLQPQSAFGENQFANEELEKLVKNSGLSLPSLSLQAELYPSGQKLIELNSDTLRNPASVSKLVTAATALSEFPPGHHFNTRLMSSAPIKGSTLEGDLYLVGGGDPAFVSESMWNLVNQFIRTGVSKIKGNIIVDDTAFDSVRFGNSRRKGRVDRAYDAPVGAMSFNWNSANIFIRPGNKEGEPAKVWLDPENEYLSLVNKTKTVKGNLSQISANRQSTEKGDQIIVTGQIGVNAAEVTIYKSITKPALWSGYHLKAFLERRGVKIEGQVKTGEQPDSAKELALNKSKDVAALVSDMNKFSNNYVAEMLIKNLASKNGEQATLSEGVKQLQSYLTTKGFTDKEMVIHSPSGLSNDNRMTAAATNKLLKLIRDDFAVFPEFITSLPVAGVDGTLKNRFKKGQGWVRAKTGYLNGSVSLAGYGGRKDGQMLIFSFFQNGKADSWKVRKFFDDLAEALTNVELK